MNLRAFLALLALSGVIATALMVKWMDPVMAATSLNQPGIPAGADTSARDRSSTVTRATPGGATGEFGPVTSREAPGSSATEVARSAARGTGKEADGETLEPKDLPLARDGELAFGAFHDWLREWVGNGRRVPLSMDEGVRLAQRRRDEMVDLIQADPRRALELALPAGWKAALPAAVGGWIEERVAGRGDFEVLCAWPEPGRETEVRSIQRYAVIEGRRWEAFVYGKRSSEVTRRGVRIQGVALEGYLAVDAEPDWEPGAAGPEGEGGTVLAASQATEGLKRLLLIRVDFSDLTGEPFSTSRASALTREVHEFYQDNSYGRAGFFEVGSGSAVTPVLRMPRTASFYGGNNDPDALRDHALAAAEAAGYDPADYDYDVTCLRSVAGFNWAGLGFVGAPGAWIRGTSSTGVTAHELGHNFGLNHANFWDTGGASIGGGGASIEYGDKFDTMGAASAGANHFNARYKRLLDWLPAGEFTVATTNGVYRLYALDQTNAVAGARGLQVFDNARTNYWVEFRQRFTANAWMMNGAGLRWTGRGNESSLLLDTSPGSAGEKDDSPILIGSTYSDPVAGVHLTPLAKGGSAPAWLDVAVYRGAFSGNHPPALSLQSSLINGTTSTAFRFQAVAVDPDGDPLAYLWEFGDGTLGENTSEITHRWTRTGDYRVQCTVSDLRGGVARASVVIRVGSPTTYRLSGRVTRLGQPLGGIRVGAGQARPGNPALTDTDGSYTLTGLTRGTYTLTATTPGGERLVPSGFQNPLSVSRDVEGLDFSEPDAGSVRSVTLLAAGSPWRYWDAGTLPGANWTQADYDDRAWDLGAAILGYGGDRETTVISYGSSSSQKQITAWFRRGFIVDDPGALTRVTLGLLRDDGAAVYLNGEEIVRDNLPSGTLTLTTRASATVGGADELTYFEHDVDPSRLRSGTNVLAVEVHQVSPTSSDTAFDLRLSAEVSEAATPGLRLASPEGGAVFAAPAEITLAAVVGEAILGQLARLDFVAGTQLLGSVTGPPFVWPWDGAPAGEHALGVEAHLVDGSVVASTKVSISVLDPELTPTLVSLGSRWKYRDTGVTPEPTWTSVGYEDGAWKEGPARLGYGEDGEFTVVDFGPDPSRRYITTWFRHAFNLEGAGRVTNLVCRVQYDDGAAVYLNGSEVARLGLRAGTLSPTQLALFDVRNEAEQAFSRVTIDPSALVEGRNLIAVEVHQAVRNSNDLGFDLELTALKAGSVAPPTLSWQRTTEGLVLYWPAGEGDWRLETTESLTPPAAWQLAGGNAERVGDQFVQAVPDASAFYRLVR